MSLGHGSVIVRDGLILSLDAANVKSYPGSGTTWFDISNQANNGTLVNGPTFSNGAFTFDGTDDYVQTASNGVANNSSFSLECWFRITTLNSIFRPLIDGGNLGTGTTGFTLSIDNTNKLFIAANAGFQSISTALSTNTWYHVVATAQFGTPYVFAIYVNSVQGTVSSSANSSAMTNNVTNYRIGQNTNGSITRFPGSMSVVRVYSRALNSTEIGINFNASRGRFGV